ncbi:MAG: PQQ-binding-like beta-propeller repeat protein, partial [Gemmataceae bacterium]
MMPALSFTLGLLLAAPADSLAPAPTAWPAFRGDLSTGTGDAGRANLPTTWSEGDKEKIRWKVAVPGKGWASPVIAEGKLWLTTASPDGKTKATMAFDPATGATLHDVPLFPEIKPAFAHAFNSHASPTPVIAEGRVFAHFGSAGTAALDARTGNILWQKTDLKCDHWRGAASSPIVVGNKLILLFDGHDQQYVVALDVRTGEILWKTDRKIKYSSDDGDIKKAYATAAVLDVGGQKQLVCPSAEQTIAYHPETGAELWRVGHGGMNGSARPIGGNGLLFLTSGHNGQLLAVNPTGATGLLPSSAIVWKLSRDVPTRPSILLVGEHLYMVDDRGMASCVAAKTGKIAWKERVGGEYSASPLHANGNIYLFDQDGRTHV